jgi:hypothetical protein
MCPSDSQLLAFALLLFVLYFQLVEDIGHICGTERGVTRKDISGHDGRSFIPGEIAASLLLTYPEQP